MALAKEAADLFAEPVAVATEAACTEEGLAAKEVPRTATNAGAGAAELRRRLRPRRRRLLWVCD